MAYFKLEEEYLTTKQHTYGNTSSYKKRNVPKEPVEKPVEKKSNESDGDLIIEDSDFESF
jgi:hypothetical protein